MMWEIKLVPNSDPGLVVDNKICNGTTWPDLLTIYISEELNYAAAKRVITHELTHAFLFSTQIRPPEEFTEEDVCELMARWGSQITRMAEETFFYLYLGPGGDNQ